MERMRENRAREKAVARNLWQQAVGDDETHEEKRLSRQRPNLSLLRADELPAIRPKEEIEATGRLFDRDGDEPGLQHVRIANVSIGSIWPERRHHFLIAATGFPKGTFRRFHCDEFGRLNPHV